MGRAATALLTAAVTAGGLVAMAAPAAAAEIPPRHLTISVTDLGPEHRDCEIAADLYIPAGVTASRRAPRCS